jgi:hypothetical protein
MTNLTLQNPDGGKISGDKKHEKESRNSNQAGTQVIKTDFLWIAKNEQNTSGQIGYPFK